MSNSPAIGLSRTVTTTLPYFGMAPYVFARSNLLFTTTRALATHYTKLLPLRIEPIPGEPRRSPIISSGTSARIAATRRSGCAG